MIKTIIFDLSEVYLRGLLGSEKKIGEALNASPEEVLIGLKKGSLIEYFQGYISEEEYLKSVITANNWKIDVDIIKSLIRENFQEIEGMRRIIERIKENNYKLGLLSVHSKEWIDYCEDKFNYHSLFDEVCYSFENALMKPNHEAYNHILNKLKSSPEESLFIDDSKDNILAAQELKINTIHFENPTQLVAELKKYSIII